MSLGAEHVAFSWLGVHADVVLPPDIEQIWGQGRKDSTGCPAANTARYLIGEWGLERFRGSALHKAALEEERRRVVSREAQDDFRKRDLKAIGGGES